MKYTLLKSTANSEFIQSDGIKTGIKCTVTLEIELTDMNPARLQEPINEINQIIANSFLNGDSRRR